LGQWGKDGVFKSAVVGFSHKSSCRKAQGARCRMQNNPS
jgi:hypothetical protein